MTSISDLARDFLKNFPEIPGYVAGELKGETTYRKWGGETERTRDYYYYAFKKKGELSSNATHFHILGLEVIMGKLKTSVHKYFFEKYKKEIELYRKEREIVVKNKE